MASLTEVAEYIESVLRLDLETPIKGFDGTDIGASNEQAQVLANRTKWLKQQLEQLNSTVEGITRQDYVVSINKQSGEVTITADSLGASKVGHTHKPSEIETDDNAQFVSATEKQTWNAKQEALKSGDNIKTLFGISLLGSDDITFTADNIEPTKTRAYVSPENKTTWDNKQDKLVSGTNIATIHGQSLLEKDNIVLTADDVNADDKGASQKAITVHVSEKDPHEQYLTTDRAGETFVRIDKGNQSYGYLQLDKNGHIPADVMALFQAKYVLADSMEARLKIPSSGDMIVCMQTDTNVVYYLNAFEDPSVNENWLVGQSTEINIVANVFGRTGFIKAELGDYNTDLIEEKENTTKVFVSPDEKTIWSSKQDALDSGINIKTINNNPITGPGNLSITPDSIGASEIGHTHTPDSIKTTDAAQFVSVEEKEKWNNPEIELISGKDIKTLNNKVLVGSGNIDLTSDDVDASPLGHHHNPADIDTTDAAQFVSAAEKKTWNAKQDALDEKTLKTINNESLLGEGNIAITADSLGASKVGHTHTPNAIETDTDNQFVTQAEKEGWNKKQDTLVTGKNIATVFGQSLLRPNDITLSNVKDFGKSVKGVLKAGKSIGIDYDEATDTSTINFGGQLAGINIYDVTDAKANERYIYPGVRDNFDFLAYALERFHVSGPQTLTLDYDNPPGDLKYSDLPDFDLNGNIQNTAGTVEYPMSAVTSNYELYETVPIPAPADSSLRINFDLGGSGRPMIPWLTSGDAVKGVYVSSDVADNNHEAWKSFQYNETLGVIGLNDFWRSKYQFDSSKDQYYIIVEFESGVNVEQMMVQECNGFYTSSPASTDPTALGLYGRNEFDTEWVQIGTWSRLDIANGKTGWQIFKTTNATDRFKYVKITVRGVYTKKDLAALSRIQFQSGSGGLIKSAAGDYYTIDYDKVVKVTPSSTMFTDYGFGEATHLLPVEAMADLFPITICSKANISARVTEYIDSSQIAIHFPLDRSMPWTALVDFQIDEAYTESDVANMRVAATVDGSEFYILKDNAWVSIGILTTSEVSAKVLISQGMTFAELEAVTSDQWSELTAASDSAYGVGLGYGIVIENNRHKRVPKLLSFEFGSFDYWRKMSNTEVEIRIEDDKIAFKPSEDGNYKFCYRFS